MDGVEVTAHDTQCSALSRLASYLDLDAIAGGVAAHKDAAALGSEHDPGSPPGRFVGEVAMRLHDEPRDEPGGQESVLERNRSASAGHTP
jgi:hypothetical protein